MQAQIIEFLIMVWGMLSIKNKYRWLIYFEGNHPELGGGDPTIVVWILERFGGEWGFSSILGWYVLHRLSIFTSDTR